MRNFCSKSLGTVSVALFVTVPAFAQPFFRHDLSIECMVLNADAVVVGKIVTLEREKEFQEVTFAVEETLRGEHRARRTARLAKPGYWVFGVSHYSAKRLKKDGARLLVAIAKKPATIVSWIDLTDAKLKVMQADLTVCRKPDRVLRIARATIRRAPGVKKIDTFWLTVPLKGGYYFGWGGNTFVKVPVNERLQKRAQQYIRDNARWKRAEGAHALRHFKSKENIAKVKALLKDPAWEVLKAAKNNAGIEVRYYSVRATAYETLKYWGMRANKPVLREEIRITRRAAGTQPDLISR